MVWHTINLHISLSLKGLKDTVFCICLLAYGKVSAHRDQSYYKIFKTLR